MEVLSIMVTEKSAKARTMGPIKRLSLLLRSVPSEVVAFYVVSVILMNLLANKEIGFNASWIALDCGICVSWISFLMMDMLTKRFGPRASIEVSIFALLVNLIVCGILFAISKIPGNWAAFYTYESSIVNDGLNSTIGGTWYVLLGSTISMMIAAIVNSITNHLAGKLMKQNTFASFAFRSYVSTMLGQFVDNFMFAMIVSYNFFGWSLLQCITCSITGAIAELIFEIVFSPIGYAVSKNWESQNVGREYLKLVNDAKGN